MLKKNDDHGFVIKDADLFEGSTQVDLRTLRCAVCGVEPGQGVHAPPPPKLADTIAEEVAKTLATVYDRAWQDCLTEAPRAAFRTVQELREFLAKLSDDATFIDTDASYAFGFVDRELDHLLTDLRKLGWDQGDQR